jgi:hypothetical protein
MNDVQKFILKRAMQKVANEDNKIPRDYRGEKASAYYSQNPYDRIIEILTPGGDEIYGDMIPFARLPSMYQRELPKLRVEQAREQAHTLGLLPGTNAYNQMVKYLIEQGETNWHNFNNPKNPKPNIKVPHFEHDNGVDIKKLNNDQERVRKAGRTMVSTDNYKKLSGNA